MKRFLKNASIYLLIMVLIAAVIFSLNYFYGRKISRDLEAEMRKSASENDYQLRYIAIETNPLMQEMNIQNLNLIKADDYNLILNQAEIKFSFKQILNYIRNGSFQLERDLETKIMQINYSNLKENYQLNFENSDLFYQGGFNLSDLNKLDSLLKAEHKLEFDAEEMKYDFPYYRSYGINNEDWKRLSTFRNFSLKADYDSQNKNLNVSEFNLSSEFLRLIFDLESELEYAAESEKVIFRQLKTNYDFLLAADEMELEENSFFKDLSFKQLASNGFLDFVLEEDLYEAKEIDFNLNLEDFKLLLSEEMSTQLNQSTFGILAQNNEFEVAVNSFSYQQNYTFPNGESKAELQSSIIDAFLNAEYNYSEEIPYLSSAELRYQPKTAKAEQLNSFMQLLLGKRFKEDEDGYFIVEAWGDIDDLNFE